MLAAKGSDRQAAAEELRGFAIAGFRSAFKALTAAANSGSEPDVIVVEPLLQWCRAKGIHDNYHDWEVVISLLTKINSPHVVEALVRAIESKTLLSAATIELIRTGSMRDPGIIPALAQCLTKDSLSEIRRAAGQALEQFGPSGMQAVSDSIRAEQWSEESLELLIAHGEIRHITMLVKLAEAGNGAALVQRTIGIGLYGRTVEARFFADGNFRGNHARWSVKQLSLLLTNYAGSVSLNDLCTLVNLEKSTQFDFDYDEESNRQWVSRSSAVDCSMLQALAAHEIEHRAANGSIDAQVLLAKMHSQGRGVPQDDAAAVHWFREATSHGNLEAEWLLGWMYQQGRGVDKNYVEALRCYRHAADNNHAAAQMLLGAMYAEGLGVQLDDMEAVRWYRNSAGQNYAFGQVSLGDMYAAGRGVQKNPSIALFWYEAGASQGNGLAAERAKALRSQGVLPENEVRAVGD
jgi:TPR repeat protein